MSTSTLDLSAMASSTSAGGGASAFWFDVGIGIAISAALISLKVRFEHTHAGKAIAFTTYDYIQHALGRGTTKVTVVNISELGHKYRNDVQRFVTDRQALSDLLDVIARERPTAIALDCDFAPNVTVGTSVEFHDKENDAYLFEQCLAVREFSNIPVFLGVSAARMCKVPRAYWLGSPRYSAMASIVSAPAEDNQMAVHHITIGSSNTTVLSLGAALGEVASTPRTWTRWPSWLATSGETFVMDGVDAVASDFYMEAGALSNIIDATVSAAQVLEAAISLKDRLVLLGVTTPGRLYDDSRIAMAGLNRRAFPGVYHHAVAAHTMASGPIYRLTSRGRVIVDGALSAFVFVLAMRMRTWAKRRGALSVFWVHRIATWTTMGFALVFGVLMVGWTRIVWDDFLFVCGALLAHDAAERPIHLLKGKAAACEKRM